MHGQHDAEWELGPWDAERLEHGRGKRSASTRLEVEAESYAMVSNKRRGPHIGCQVGARLPRLCKLPRAVGRYLCEAHARLKETLA